METVYNTLMVEHHPNAIWGMICEVKRELEQYLLSPLVDIIREYFSLQLDLAYNTKWPVGGKRLISVHLFGESCRFKDFWDMIPYGEYPSGQLLKMGDFRLSSPLNAPNGYLRMMFGRMIPFSLRYTLNDTIPQMYHRSHPRFLLAQPRLDE